MTLQTFHKGVAHDVLRQAQGSPPLSAAGHRVQEVMNVLVVDFTEGNPNRELDVWFQLQVHSVVCHDGRLGHRTSC